MKGQIPLEMGNNQERLKIAGSVLKAFFFRTTRPKQSNLGERAFKFVKIKGHVTVKWEILRKREKKDGVFKNLLEKQKTCIMTD